MSNADTLRIDVKLFATFREGRFVSESRTYQVGTTIDDIIKELEIPVPEIGIIMLNSRHSEASTVLTDGDKLGIFPKVGGG